ncbi:MAG: pentapeptide repeat-containing protein [Oscillospiraceae bacterium]|jgi:uncharacterized protein YjbI with pentapeptide repeats|nr:pentapeptide repeat-containing protein [Oscillospiraceae bacterium]
MKIKVTPVIKSEDNFSGAELKQISFENTKVCESSMAGAIFDRVNFTGAKIVNSDITNLVIDNCKVENLIINGCKVELVND